MQGCSPKPLGVYFFVEAVVGMSLDVLSDLLGCGSSNVSWLEEMKPLHLRLRRSNDDSPVPFREAQQCVFLLLLEYSATNLQLGQGPHVTQGPS